MFSDATYLYWLIVGCEAAFWIVLAIALAVRYVLRRERLSRVLLLALPAVDILLLIFTALDLRAGSPPTFAHGLALAYIGFTVAFGPVLVRWADRHFAHRFAGGPSPAVEAPLGWAAVRSELDLWLRCIVAWAITLAIMIALMAYLDDEAVTRALTIWFRIALGSVFLWFLFGPLWSVVFFRRAASK
jgi:hypothetical protein